MKSLLAGIVLAAPLALLIGAPAAAVGVDADATVGIRFPKFGVSDVAQTEFFLASEALSIEFGPNIIESFGGDATVSAEVGLGEAGQSSAVVEGTVTVTNLIDQALTVEVDAFRQSNAGVTFEAPGDAGGADASTVITFDGVRADRGRAFVDIAFEGSAPSDFCEALPCFFDDFDVESFLLTFDVEALGTVIVGLRAEASVTAETTVAPIPLPAAAGPAAPMLGGLAWAGRRRAGRSPSA